MAIQRDQVLRAFRMARLLKWFSAPLGGIFLFFGILIGVYTEWYIGMAIILFTWLAIFFVGYNFARCPACRQIWYTKLGLAMFLPWYVFLDPGFMVHDETESAKCRRCGLNIGEYLDASRRMKWSPGGFHKS